MITLLELLARRELGLTLTGSAINPATVTIVAAEVCDLPDPRPWLDQGSMLLTTGVGVGHSAHAQRLCVERAAQAGVATIGFGVGLAHAVVPPGVLDAARELAIPLVSVPPGTPFRTLVGAVGERAGPHQLETAERGLSIQSYLMEALAAPAPADELLRRLGSLLNGTALIVDDSGEIEGGPRSAMPRELWGPMRGARTVVVHHIRGRRYLTTPVATGPVGRWLVVAGDSLTLPDQLARQAVKSGERLVRLIDRARPPRPTEARILRRDLADRLLGLRPLGNRHALTLRVTALGFDVDQRAMALVLRPTTREQSPEGTGQQIAQIEGAIETVFSARSWPFVLTDDDRGVIAIVGGATAGLAEALEEVARATVALEVGGGRLALLHDLERSLRDARLGLARIASRRDDEGDSPLRLLTHADFDLVTTLAADADQALATQRAVALLGRIRGDDLRATLLAYLDHDLDVPRTAASLHLHANSLRYRLGRIEEELGMPLRSPTTIANLQLALLLSDARPLVELGRVGRRRTRG